MQSIKFLKMIYCGNSQTWACNIWISSSINHHWNSLNHHLGIPRLLSNGQYKRAISMFHTSPSIVYLQQCQFYQGCLCFSLLALHREEKQVYFVSICSWFDSIHFLFTHHAWRNPSGETFSESQYACSGFDRVTITLCFVNFVYRVV